ncbi:MAG: polyphosphate polymerase domain-containing protein [Calditrichaceae bacterium]
MHTARIECKYRVSNKQLPALRNAMLPYMVLDNYSECMPDKQYTVRSIYFDTRRLDYYHDKLAGLRRRKKLRIRGYNRCDEGNCLIFLEIKRKDGPTITKARAPVYFKDHADIINNGDLDKYKDILNTVDEGFNDAKKFLYHLYTSNLIPTIKIIYDREAFYYKFNRHLRVTFDKNLRSSLVVDPEYLYEEENIRYGLPSQTILEVKVYGEIPGWLQKIIGAFQLQQEAISKYTVCLESHSPFERHLERTVLGKGKYKHHKSYANWEMD